MTYYSRSGSRYRVSADANIDIKEALPVGTYTVKYDGMSEQFYLEQIADFKIGGKVYGDTEKLTTRILDTFADRPNSTGIMLSGEKGSGKTLQARMLSIHAAKAGIPTIVINAPWAGEEFNSFIQLIDQPTVIIFDEFEKVYDKDSQEKMLTLLDGVYQSKKLFVLTCNDKYRVNEHMKNRPGRIYYRKDYKGLDNEFIIEYCEDNLIEKSHTLAITRLGMMFSEFNFDMLKAIVEEINRYGESPEEAVKLLNAKPENSSGSMYEKEFWLKGEKLEEKHILGRQWHGNPLSSTVYIEYADPADFLRATLDDKHDVTWEDIEFNIHDLKTMDPAAGTFTFADAQGNKLILTEVRQKEFNWAAF